MKFFYRASAYLSPEDYTTEETDFQYIQVLVHGWKEKEMKERVVKHITSVEKMYQLQIDEENAEIEKRRASREKLLNSGILWLGVLSVAGTIAGVIQFIDFDNSLTTTDSRIAIIVAMTGIAISTFLFLQLYGRVLKKK